MTKRKRMILPIGHLEFDIGHSPLALALEEWAGVDGGVA
jgi:hypothetical protein